MAVDILLNNNKSIIEGIYLPSYNNCDEHESAIMMRVGFIESIFAMYEFDINCSFYVSSKF